MKKEICQAVLTPQIFISDAELWLFFPSHFLALPYPNMSLEEQKT